MTMYVIKFNKYKFVLKTIYFKKDECANILIQAYKENCKAIDSHIQYGPDHPVEEVIQYLAKVLVKHLNLNKIEIIEKGLKLLIIIL